MGEVKGLLLRKARGPQKMNNLNDYLKYWELGNIFVFNCYLGNSSNDFPINPRQARRGQGCDRLLSSALHVNVGGLLLSVGGSRQDDVGKFGACVSVVALKTKLLS